MHDEILAACQALCLRTVLHNDASLTGALNQLSNTKGECLFKLNCNKPYLIVDSALITVFVANGTVAFVLYVFFFRPMGISIKKSYDD